MHRRQIEGETLAFGVQGGLYRDAMTWWDHGTGSLWSQPTGSAIAGPSAGDQLELLPSTLTTWLDWRETHPETRALDVDDAPSGTSLDRLAVVVVAGNESKAYLVFPRDYIRFFPEGAFWLPTGDVAVAGCEWDQGTDASNLRGLVECGE